MTGYDQQTGKKVSKQRQELLQVDTGHVGGEVRSIWGESAAPTAIAAMDKT